MTSSGTCYRIVASAIIQVETNLQRFGFKPVKLMPNYPYIDTEMLMQCIYKWSMNTSRIMNTSSLTLKIFYIKF